jgi:hypothetical protein
MRYSKITPGFSKSNRWLLSAGDYPSETRMLGMALIFLAGAFAFGLIAIVIWYQ